MNNTIQPILEMSDLSDKNSDILVIDTSVTPKSGDFIILLSNKKYEVKKMKLINEVEYVLSDNFKLEPISEVESILGVVIKFIHSL